MKGRFLKEDGIEILKRPGPLCIENPEILLLRKVSVTLCSTSEIPENTYNDHNLRKWAAEVAKEIEEQKPEFAVVHIQGFMSAEDPEFAARVIHGWCAVGIGILAKDIIYVVVKPNAKRDDGTRDLSQQRTAFLLSRFRIHGKEVGSKRCQSFDIRTPLEASLDELNVDSNLSRAMHLRIYFYPDIMERFNDDGNDGFGKLSELASATTH
ncbi:hypothetical protein DICVIV_11372 [Dictyocaulus viviparus]|uniref:Uncharacterized protein n=1 Tax=Dictyocaulus viviparus TaxID=29172 RepID=A0A0D8XDC6_DICVI|nr:hypothetical protein DICVIV_11372 [Dictyocaulus viviparus]